MNVVGQFAARLYVRLLGFYPAAFQAAFAEEMQEVFAQRATEAAGEGPLHIASVCLRELKDYPLNLVREYWSASQKKEVVMATTGSASIEAGICPRCGDLKTEETRYCPNCGRAFIPLPVLVPEQVRNFLNSRVTSILFGTFALLFVLVNAKWQFVYELFYPRSYWMMAAGLGGASLLIFWLLARVKTNAIRLGVILVSMFAVLLLNTGVEVMDNEILRSEIKTGQPVTYQFLGLTTALERLEAVDFDPDAHKINFNLPPCDSFNWACLQSFEWLEKDEGGAVIVVERSWRISSDFYLVLLLGYVLGLPGLAFWLSRRIKQRRAAAG